MFMNPDCLRDAKELSGDLRVSDVNISSLTKPLRLTLSTILIAIVLDVVRLEIRGFEAPFRYWSAL